ncbi:MAG: hypothetical protein NTY19_11185 [Planctomycetota bacterium]|nr:hypothetical protein [Planctomycetota bacterium]
MFRDLRLAFATAMIGIYVLLVAQMGSFTVPLSVLLTYQSRTDTLDGRWR